MLSDTKLHTSDTTLLVSRCKTSPQIDFCLHVLCPQDGLAETNFLLLFTPPWQVTQGFVRIEPVTMDIATRSYEIWHISVRGGLPIRSFLLPLLNSHSLRIGPERSRARRRRGRANPLKARLRVTSMSRRTARSRPSVWAEAGEAPTDRQPGPRRLA